MSDERSSKEKASAGGSELCLVFIRASLLRKVESVKTGKRSTLETQKAKEKNEDESWYFTHV